MGLGFSMMFLRSSNQPLSGRTLAAAFICALGLGLALALTLHDSTSTARTASVSVVKKPAWLTRVMVTEYYPARESWFAGKRIKPPGISGRNSKIDWLYS